MKDRIKKIRLESNCTQQEFADRLGLSRSFIIQVEKGDRQASDRTIKDICNTFGVSELWIRTGEGDMKANILPLDEDALLVAKYTDPDTPLGKAYLRILKIYDKYPAVQKAVVDDFINKFLEQSGDL